MPSLSDTQKRIRSVKNTKQITKAMEVVSATKMRRAQELALRARPYAFTAFDLLANASKRLSAKEKLPALLAGNDSKKTLAIVIASDKGLAGSLNANVMRKAHAALSSFIKGGGAAAPEDLQSKSLTTSGPLPFEKGEVDLATVGKKTRDYFAFRKFEIVKEFVGHGDYVDIAEMNELHDFILKSYADGVYGKVVFVYTNFLSTLRQEAVVRQALPIIQENLNELIVGLAPEKGRFSELSTADHRPPADPEPYLYEPSRARVISELADRLFKMMLYHIQLEANASEHSARMVAMKTASENAEEIVDNLTLVYNKGRQAKITQEIVEITSGSDAVA